MLVTCIQTRPRVLDLDHIPSETISQRALMRIRIVYKLQVQPDRINMALFFCYLVKNYLSSVRVYGIRTLDQAAFIYRILCAGLGTRKTRPCLSGRVVKTQHATLHRKNFQTGIFYFLYSSHKNLITNACPALSQSYLNEK